MQCGGLVNELKKRNDLNLTDHFQNKQKQLKKNPTYHSHDLQKHVSRDQTLVFVKA